MRPALRPPPRFPAGLLHHVRQQGEEARPLDGPGQLALLAGRHRGDTARHDLAAFRHVAAEEARVLVVDLGRVIAREWAGLAATVERTPRGGAGCIGHGLAPLVWIARATLGIPGRARPARPVAIAAFPVAAEATAAAAIPA